MNGCLVVGPAPRFAVCRLSEGHAGRHSWESEEQFLDRVAPDADDALTIRSNQRMPLQDRCARCCRPFGPVRSTIVEKPRFVLIPPYAEAAVARVLTRGAAVYGDRDWATRISVPDGPDAFVDKALRHINEWRRGTSKDQGTGESPLANAIADLLFVLEHEITEGEGQ